MQGTVTGSVETLGREDQEVEGACLPVKTARLGGDCYAHCLWLSYVPQRTTGKVEGTRFVKISTK